MALIKIILKVPVLLNLAMASRGAGGATGTLSTGHLAPGRRKLSGSDRALAAANLVNLASLDAPNLRDQALQERLIKRLQRRPKGHLKGRPKGRPKGHLAPPLCPLVLVQAIAPVADPVVI